MLIPPKKTLRVGFVETSLPAGQPLTSSKSVGVTSLSPTVLPTALRRRDPWGAGSDLHSAPAAPGPRTGSVGAQAPATRLHAHRSVDHHLLLLAYRHHRHLQGRSGVWRGRR